METTLAKELFSIKQEVAEIEKQQKEELAPKKKLLLDLQTRFVDELTQEGLKSIKTTEANFSLATRKAYKVTSEPHALKWAKENNAVSIDKRLVGQILKDLEEVPSFFEETETNYLTIKPISSAK